VYETGEVKTLNYPIDEDKVVFVSIAPIKAGDRGNSRLGVVGLFQDISELERLERVRRDYVANVSHELRTPLTAIQGLLEPLSDGLVKDEPTVKRYYSIMYHEVKRLSRLISDMMEISRLQSRNDALVKTEIDVCGIAADVRENFIVQASEKRITLGIDCESKEMIAYSDPDRVEQMMIIFIDNAMRYTPAGGSIIIGIKDTDEERFIVSVADSGTGIPKKDLPHIFERFYKVDKSRREGGTGLGLSIASQITDMLGEKLWVESEQGHGTTFFFTLRKPPKTVRGQSELSIDTAEDETRREGPAEGTVDADFQIIK
jgi:signal transduction histidine kinase